MPSGFGHAYHALMLQPLLMYTQHARYSNVPMCTYSVHTCESGEGDQLLGYWEGRGGQLFFALAHFLTMASRMRIPCLFQLKPPINCYPVVMYTVFAPALTLFKVPLNLI